MSTNESRKRAVVAKPLGGEDAWAPFGWLPVADTDPRDGTQHMTFEWDDPHVNLIGHRRSEVPDTADGYRCEMLYRHDTHTQSLMPLNVPAVIAVAPANIEFTDEGDAELIQAFRLEPLEPLVLHRGTWHWGTVPDPRGGRGPAVQRAGTSVRRGQSMRGSCREGALRRRGAPVSAGGSSRVGAHRGA